jgi:hypothetical protein
MTPLLKGEMSPPEVLRYVGAGAVEMYAGTIFSGIAAYAGPFAGAVLALLVGAFVAGLAGVALRGPRLLAALAVLGAFAPPFIYIAGIARLGGPGTGYTDRYTYLILPAVLSVCAWALGRLAARAGKVRGAHPAGFWRGRALRSVADASPATGRAGATTVGGG